jgi:hypothetical protein
MVGTSVLKAELKFNIRGKKSVYTISELNMLKKKVKRGDVIAIGEVLIMVNSTHTSSVALNISAPESMKIRSANQLSKCGKEIETIFNMKQIADRNRKQKRVSNDKDR